MLSTIITYPYSHVYSLDNPLEPGTLLVILVAYILHNLRKCPKLSIVRPTYCPSRRVSGNQTAITRPLPNFKGRFQTTVNITHPTRNDGCTTHYN